MSNHSASILEFPKPKFSNEQDKTVSSSEESLSISKENLVEKKITGQLEDLAQPIITAELLHDLENLSSTKLRNKYSREANSHKNRKTACKNVGGKFSSEFDEFRSFLRHAGVIPTTGKWTLDRIDNSNHDYFPGGVRWASAKTQNNNKSDTIYLTFKGETRPLTAWAKQVNKSADTLRKRHQRGWPDHWVIFGKPPKKTESHIERSGVWKRLVPDREPDSYKKIEAHYRITRFWNPTGTESRQCWLAAVARQHLEKLRETLIDQNYEGSTDPELEFQYGCWMEILDNIQRELPVRGVKFVSDFAYFRKRRFAGQMTWRH